MKGTKTTKTVRKKLGAWVHPTVHARVKAAAAMEGQTIEEWLAGAAQDKLVRLERARASVRGEIPK